MASPANTLLDTTHPSGQQPLKWLIGRVAIREHNKHCTYCVLSTLTPMPNTHKHKHTHAQRGREKQREREGEEKQTHCMEPWGITLAHTGLHFISCGLCQCCLFTSWEPGETGGNVFDGLDLEILWDFDLLFRKIENWICCVIPANEEPVLARNTDLLIIIHYHRVEQSFFWDFSHCSSDLFYNQQAHEHTTTKNDLTVIQKVWVKYDLSMQTSVRK